MKRVIIIDYGSGNLRSVQKAFQHVAEGTPVEISGEPTALAQATHIVLPGVGAFADCMRGLMARPGLREALEENVRAQKKPFLGICVGMQLLFEEGREHGTHKGLGWLRGKVVALTPSGTGLKVPHMGWNELKINQPSHPLLQGISNGDHAYFVHSYRASAEKADVLAEVDYGGAITAAVAHENIMGTQFHPEKSQETGLRLLRNFVNL